MLPNQLENIRKHIDGISSDSRSGEQHMLLGELSELSTFLDHLWSEKHEGIPEKHRRRIESYFDEIKMTGPSPRVCPMCGRPL